MLSIITWIIIAVFAVVIDIATSSFLFCWFAVGALAAMVGALFGVTVTVQILIFLVVSIITIAICYPWAMKKFKNSIKRIPLMEETYIGRVIKAEEDIEKKSRIKVDGIYWAIQNNGETIKTGSNFIITGIEGNKLVVKKEEDI